MTITNIPPYVPSYEPSPNVTPFTYRDGITMLKKMDGLVRYLNRVIIPYINSEFDNLANSVEEDIQQLIDVVNAAIDQIINDSIEVQDAVVAGIFENPASATRAATDALYAAKSVVDEINTIINSGRLSQTALDSAYASITAFNTLSTTVTNLTATVSDLTTTVNGKVDSTYANNQLATKSTKNIVVCWGDSLSDNTFESYLAAITGYNVIDGGVSGEISSSTAFRQGGIVFTNNAIVSIPTSGPVSFDVTASNIPFAITLGSVFPVKFNGIDGSLTFNTRTGAVTGIGNVTFTRTSAGATITVPAGAMIVANEGQDKRADTAVIWVGVNDQQNLDPNHVANVVTSVDAMVAYMNTDTKDYIILAPTTGSDLSARARTIRISLALQKKYPTKFYDIRRFIIDKGLALCGLSPTSQDLTDIANDTVPTSLRVDNIHLTPACYQYVVAPYIADILNRNTRPARVPDDSWTTLTLDPTVTAGFGKAKIVNGIVYLWVEATAGTFTSATSLVGTLPQYMCPDGDLFFPLNTSADGTTYVPTYVRVWGGGAVTLGPNFQKPNIKFMVAYPAKLIG